MDTTSWLQLIIGVETALTIGVVIGVVVGGRLAASVNSCAQDTHPAGAAQGRVDECSLRLARAEGGLEAVQRLGRGSRQLLSRLWLAMHLEWGDEDWH